MVVLDPILLDGKRALEDHGGAMFPAPRASDCAHGAGRMGR